MNKKINANLPKEDQKLILIKNIFKILDIMNNCNNHIKKETSIHIFGTLALSVAKLVAYQEAFYLSLRINIK